MSHQLQGKRFGFMNEKFDQWFLDQLENDPEDLADLSHHKIMEEAGAEAVELIMWLTMRGALSPKREARASALLRAHDHRHGPDHLRGLDERDVGCRRPRRATVTTNSAPRRRVAR